MAFGVGDSLRVRVSAATKDFERGMENAQDSLNSVRNASLTTSGAIQGLQNRVNELGDEFGRAERKASSLSRSLGVLTGAVSALNVSVLGFNAVQLSGMIAGFGTLLTTVVPLTSALFGLVAATTALAGGFATVIGTGFLAYGEQVAEQTEDVEGAMEGLVHALEPVKEQFLESALAIGEEFAPLIGDLIDALPAFIRQVEDALGNLQPFADALRDAGQVAFEVLPEMIGWFAQLGRESLPMLREFGSWLADNWQNILETSVETLRELTPVLLGFIDGMIDLIGPMNEFGTVVLQEVLPAVNGFATALGNAMETVEDNEGLIKGILVGSFIAILGPLGAVIALLVKFRDTVAESLGNINSRYIQPFLDGFNDAFDNQIPRVLDEVGDTIDTAIQAFKDLFGLEGDAKDLGTAVGDAFNTIQEAIIDLNDLLQGDITVNDIFGDNFETNLREIVSTTDSALGRFERLLVGESGSGGLAAAFDTATTNAQQWLQNQGPEIIKPGIGALVDAAVDAAQSFSVILVGPDGKSGVLTDMVDQAHEWLTTTAPKLMKAAGKAVGSAIRDGLIDFTNPLRGKDSEIWDMLADATTWLVTNAPKLFAAAGAAIVDGILAGVVGLVEGLVGNSVIKDALQDAADIAIANMDSWMGGIGDAIVDSILSGITGLTSAIANKIESSVSDAAEAVSDAKDEMYGDDTSDTGDESDPTSTTSSPSATLSKVSNQGGEWMALIAEPGFGEHWVDVDALSGELLDKAMRLISQQTGGGGTGTDTGPSHPMFSSMATGGFIEQAGLAMLHSGERVVPASQVTDRGEVSLDPETIAEGVARGFSRVDTGTDENVTVEVELRDTGRYTASQR